jgi:hypothetical protein
LRELANQPFQIAVSGTLSEPRLQLAGSGRLARDFVEQLLPRLTERTGELAPAMSELLDRWRSRRDGPPGPVKTLRELVRQRLQNRRDRRATADEDGANRPPGPEEDRSTREEEKASPGLDP